MDSDSPDTDPSGGLNGQGLGINLSFNAGDLIGRRFRLESFLGQGGMGQVYQAKDLELGETVAIKVLRPDLLGRPDLEKRFKKEIRLARQVTHPHICRIFDLVYHDFVDDLGTRYRMPALSMELLPGRSLSEWIREEGALDPSVALGYAEQIASGLDAAHRVGILHRDLKSGNIMLLKDDGQEESKSGARPHASAVITDFGLARWIPEEGSSQTETAALVGTPAFLAPEQISGDLLGATTDIYAFGVVLFHMVTGELPFKGESQLATVVKRLSQAPPSPRSIKPDLPVVWEKVILKCLEKDPKDRFQSGRDVIRALQGERRQGRSRFPLVEVVALVLVMVAYIGWFRSASPKVENSTVTQVSTTVRPTVAVFEAENLGENPSLAWVGTAIREMLATDLIADESLRTVPGYRMSEMSRDLDLNSSREMVAADFAQIGAYLGADFLLRGTFLSLDGEEGGELRLDLRLIDLKQGVVRDAVSERGSQADLITLVETAGRKIRNNLGYSSNLAPSLESTAPRDPRAARLYSEGLEALRDLDLKGAREKLERALEIEQDQPLVELALSRTFDAMGFEARAQTTAAAALVHSENLPRSLRMAIEAHDARVHGRWEEAAASEEALYRFFPDDPEYALTLSRDLTRIGRAAEALGLLEELEEERGTDARIKLFLAEAAGKAGDKNRQLEEATGSYELAQELGAASLMASALLEKTQAYRRLGQYEEARAAASQAEALLAHQGDESGRARALHAQGVVLRRIGSLAEAEDRYREARSRYERAGNRRGMADVDISRIYLMMQRGQLEAAKSLGLDLWTRQKALGTSYGQYKALSALGQAHSALGDLDQAGESFRLGLVSARQSGDQSAMAGALNNLAIHLSDQGDREEAVGLYNEALEVFRRLGHRQGEMAALNNLAVNLLAQGELDTATQRFEEVLALYRDGSDRSSEAMVLFNLGEVALEQGEYSRAEKVLNEAQSLQKELGEELAEAKARINLARSYLGRGRRDEARMAAAQAAEHLRELGAIDLSVWAHSVAARAALYGEKPEALGEHLEAVGRYLSQEDAKEPSLRYRLVLHEIRGHQGHLVEDDLRVLALTAEASGEILLHHEAEILRAGFRKDSESLQRLNSMAVERGWGRLEALASSFIKEN